MSNHIDNESNQGDLGTLPENEQKETKEILDQIEKEESGKTETTTQDDAAKAEADKVAKEEADAKAKADAEAEAKKADGDDQANRRNGKLVPAWVLEKEKTQRDKEIADLKAKIDEISKGANLKPEDGKETTTTSKAEDIKAVIEKFKIDVDPAFMEAIVEIASKGKEMPEELQKRLAEIDKIAHEREVEVEELSFSADFDKTVLPLIKAEYGDNVPADKLAEIKDKLKGIAYTAEYQKVPYDEIYNGKKEFRGLVAQGKRSAEGSRETSVNLKPGEKDYANMTEEEVKGLSGEEFDKWSDAMSKNEKSS